MKPLGFLLDFLGFLVGVAACAAILFLEPRTIEAALRWIGL